MAFPVYAQLKCCTEEEIYNKADVIRRTVLHIAIFVYTKNGNLTDPKPNPSPTLLTLTITLIRSFIHTRNLIRIELITHTNCLFAAKNI